MNIASLTAATRTNLRAIQTLQREMGTAQTRLASGYEVARPLDGPQAYFAAEKLRGRADSMNHALDEVSRGRRTIEAAQAGIQAIEAMLDGLGDVARRARTASPADLGTPGTPAPSTPTTPPAAPTQPTLSVLGKQLNVGLATGVTDREELARQTLLGTHTQGGTLSGTDLGGSLAGQGKAPVAGMVTTGLNSSQADRIRITVDDGATNHTASFKLRTAYGGFDPSTSRTDDQVITVGQLVDGINRELGSVVTASVTNDGRIRLETKGNLEIRLLEKSHNNVNTWDTLEPLFGEVGTGPETDKYVFESGSGSMTTPGNGPGDTSGNRDWNNIYGARFDAGVMWVGGTPPPAPTPAPTPTTPPAASGGTPGTGLLGEWDSYLEQIDGVAADAGYRGLNLLMNGTDELRISERGALKMTLWGGDETVTGLGLSRSTAGLATQGDIDARLAELDAARTELQALSMRLASQYDILGTRETFDAAMQATFENGADDLTRADVNEESARLTAARTALDLASSALATGLTNEPFLLRYMAAASR